jgi:hypothetical protein
LQRCNRDSNGPNQVRLQLLFTPLLLLLLLLLLQWALQCC